MKLGLSDSVPRNLEQLRIEIAQARAREKIALEDTPPLFFSGGDQGGKGNGPGYDCLPWAQKHKGVRFFDFTSWLDLFKERNKIP